MKRDRSLLLLRRIAFPIVAFACLSPDFVAVAAPVPIRGSLEVVVYDPTQTLEQFQGIAPFIPLFSTSVAFSAVVEGVGTSLVFAPGAISGTAPAGGVFAGAFSNEGGTLANGFDPGGLDCSVPRPVCVEGGGYGGALGFNLEVLSVALAPVVGAGGLAPIFNGFVRGAPFSTGIGRVRGTFVIPTLDLTPFALTPRLEGTVSRTTAGALNSLSLVSPVRVELPGLVEASGFATLRIEFVPEPGTSFLFAVGLLALGTVRRLAAASATR